MNDELEKLGRRRRLLTSNRDTTHNMQSKLSIKTHCSVAAEQMSLTFIFGQSEMQKLIC